MRVRSTAGLVGAAGMALVLAAIPGVGAAVPSVSAASSAAGGPPTQETELDAEVLSSRPAFIAGGDALVRVTAPSGRDVAGVTVEVDDADVTDQFRPDADAGTLKGLVTNLPNGESTLVATADGGETAELDLVNHPITGPVFSGPHEEPFVCETADFELAVGGTLGEPLDENCSVETRVDYLYWSTEGEFRPLPSDDTRPDDLAYTTNDQDVRVPYIVRVETGTINRAVYETAILHDPAEDAEPDPWSRPAGWNERLVYKFGGGCTTGWYVQGTGTGLGDGTNPVDHELLRRGYAVGSATLNVFGTNCNDLLAAETMAMVKERFVEGYGAPALTIGRGSSGGAYQSHQIADNYPGLLDGILVGASFPDVGFGTIPMVSDARLLHTYFTEDGQGQLSEEQQQAIAGFGVYDNIEAMSGRASRITPTDTCKEQVPDELQYDPETNPDGARCEVYAHTVNVYGADDPPFINRPLDNVGVQYGLEALEDGTISVDEFLDLNEGIGGFDGDANVIDERTEAHPGATEIAYQSGRMLNGGGGLAETPIVDYRQYRDHNPAGDIHVRYQSFSTRERLRKANGSTDNHVMLVESQDNGSFGTSVDTVAGQALVELDAWITAIQEDPRPADEPVDKIARNRPHWLADSCWTDGDSPERIRETQHPGTEGSTCAELYPSYPSPRMVAGGSIESDIVKCQRKPFDVQDYEVEFSDAQAARADEVFPDGVCDWSQPGVGQQGLAGTWLRF